MSGFKTVSGVSVPSLDGIHECYEVRHAEYPARRHNSFVVNISAEHLRPILQAFCEQLDEPCFFILEMGTNASVESELRQNPTDPLHKDVFYRDGYTRAELLSLLDTYGELLLNDGMSQFGFASHVTHDEIYVGKYKIVNIFSADELRYKQFLSNFHIPQEDCVKTVWSNFSRETPGECRLVTVNGMTIYDMADALKTDGLYFAECREEP
ncbi:MAG: hypothetical protein LBQ91_06335 [Oscillospiraceae bacterium]|jgi:hypothetical protein|nr:hypothetical protein [Oscillospiraceae bacterium]